MLDIDRIKNSLKLAQEDDARYPEYDWRAAFVRDVPALVAEVELLRTALKEILALPVGTSSGEEIGWRSVTYVCEQCADRNGLATTALYGFTGTNRE